MRNRIMVIGRDAALRAHLAQLLSRAGYRAEVAESVAHARRAGLSGVALAIIAPHRLGSNEVAVVQELRAAVDSVLIIAAPSAPRSSDPDVIDLADEGRLLGRIGEALAPRSDHDDAGPVLEFAGFRFDSAGHSLVGPSGKDIPLTHSEFGLLHAFLQRTGRVLSREQLVHLTDGRDAEPYDRSVDMQIARLRRKIEPDPQRPSLIVTVAGSGYKFAAAVREAEPGSTPETAEAANPSNIPLRKLAAILAADVAGFSRLVGAHEDRTLARLRALRSDLIDPAVAMHRGRMVKRTGDGAIVEFRSVVDAVRCALEVQQGMVERNAGLPPERRIEFRIGVHLGDVVMESDGDLMGDGVNVAARLEGVCEPSGICLSGAAYEQVRDRLKETFVDLGEKTLKNISRPMRVYALKPASEGAALAPPAAHKPGPPRWSIVVLPFANLTGDPGQEHFVDGVTESLTTDLSRISGSFVIARNTALTYKRKPVDAREIGRELTVRYILEGSVQGLSTRMRVNVQLIDAESGNHLWAERFDKALGDPFDTQDEIVARLSNVVTAEVLAAEARRAKRAPNPDATDFNLQAWALWGRGITAENLAEARRLFERGLALNPADVWPLIGIANVDLAAALSFLPDDRTARLAAAEAALNKALALAPENAHAHLALGIIQIHTNRVAQGIGECDRALELNRNLVNAHGHIGYAKIVLGRAEEAETHIQEALRLSPRDVHIYLWCMFAGTAKLYLGKDDEAVNWLRRSIEINRNLADSHFLLAAALARLGRLQEARSEVQAGLGINPSFTIARFCAGAFTDYPNVVAGRERVIDGLREAGVPET
jgi:class 3 adenylate cyclase/DNA-binding response OmpR family regulator/tetratricopeptide (TPR) repeat protein